jgi:hypothetical protein
MKRQTFLALTTAVVTVGILLIVGELAVRWFSPQDSMYPRWEYSSRYGFENQRNTTIVHESPGEWKYLYWVNEFRYRGEPVPISNSYDKTNIVVLGDSYTFGIGVNDGEEYSAVLQDAIGDQFSVINLGVGGWGLTQQIRRYYEFGQVYSPELIVLQFSGNDPDDNFNYRVTTVKEGKFEFHEPENRFNRLKKYLSTSIIQKSQLYNLIRNTGFRFLQERRLEQRERAHAEGTQKDEAAPQEMLYVHLLRAFAKDLGSRDIPLVMISIKDQLRDYPHLYSEVLQLDDEGSLHCVETSDWFVGVTDYASPEGHKWGTKAHRIVGANLVAPVLQALSNKRDASTGRISADQ